MITRFRIWLSDLIRPKQRPIVFRSMPAGGIIIEGAALYEDAEGGDLIAEIDLTEDTAT